MVVGVESGKIQLSFLDFDQPMGVAVGENGIAIGSRGQVHLFRANHKIAKTIELRGPYNGCFVPQNSVYTGNIHSHDLAWGEGGLWVVNTLFSCLCTLKESYSFVPRWRPPFVSRLIDQDRCHLNGLAMHEGRPRCSKPPPPTFGLRTPGEGKRSRLIIAFPLFEKSTSDTQNESYYYEPSKKTF